MTILNLGGVQLRQLVTNVLLLVLCVGLAEGQSALISSTSASVVSLLSSMTGLTIEQIEEIATPSVQSSLPPILELLRDGNIAQAKEELQNLLVAGKTKEVEAIFAMAFNNPQLLEQLQQLLLTIYSDSSFNVVPLSLAYESIYDINSTALTDLVGDVIVNLTQSGADSVGMQEALSFAFTSQRGNVFNTFDDAIKKAKAVVGCDGLEPIIQNTYDRAGQISFLFAVALQQSPLVQECSNVTLIKYIPTTETIQPSPPPQLEVVGFVETDLNEGNNNLQPNPETETQPSSPLTSPPLPILPPPSPGPSPPNSPPPTPAPPPPNSPPPTPSPSPPPPPTPSMSALPEGPLDTIEFLDTDLNEGITVFQPIPEVEVQSPPLPPPSPSPLPPGPPPPSPGPSPPPPPTPSFGPPPISPLIEILFDTDLNEGITVFQPIPEVEIQSPGLPPPSPSPLPPGLPPPSPGPSPPPVIPLIEILFDTDLNEGITVFQPIPETEVPPTAQPILPPPSPPPPSAGPPPPSTLPPPPPPSPSLSPPPISPLEILGSFENDLNEGITVFQPIPETEIQPPPTSGPPPSPPLPSDVLPFLSSSPSPPPTPSGPPPQIPSLPSPGSPPQSPPPPSLGPLTPSLIPPPPSRTPPPFSSPLSPVSDVPTSVLSTLAPFVTSPTIEFIPEPPTNQGINGFSENDLEETQIKRYDIPNPATEIELPSPQNFTRSIGIRTTPVSRFFSSPLSFFPGNPMTPLQYFSTTMLRPSGVQGGVQEEVAANKQQVVTTSQQAVLDDDDDDDDVEDDAKFDDVKDDTKFDDVNDDTKFDEVKDDTKSDDVKDDTTADDTTVVDDDTKTELENEQNGQADTN